MQNTAVTFIGFLALSTGVGLNWGVGYALLIGGLILFLAGGLASTGKGPRAV